MMKFRLLKFIVLGFLLGILSVVISFAQVSTGGSANTSNHSKQVIGYLTEWDAWKGTAAGLPAQGALTQLNIDYSKYTIINFSFFGVASDGSLHSGDYRNKNIYQSGTVQDPADIFDTDIYSSWDLYLLFGEIDPIQYISDAVVTRAEAQGFEVVANGSTWSNPTWGLYDKPLPLPLHKEDGAPGLLELAHQYGVKVMASIGGWSMCKHFPEMAASATMRAKFVEDCKKLIAVGFDGIDLDWEYPGPYSGMNFTGAEADFTNFTILVQEIRDAIGADKLISAAMSADPEKLSGFEWSKLVAIMDYFNMMTYDFNGGWSDIAGHNAPLYSYDGSETPTFNWQATLDKLTSLGVPKNKINMGCPFYGRGVICSGTADLNVATVKRQETIQPDGPITTCADYTNWPVDVYDGTPTYFYIKQKALATGSGWTRHWDDQAKVPYLTNGSYFLSYDDEESVGYKAQFIVDNQLAGSIIWTSFGDLEISGTETDFGTKLKRWSDVESVLVNKINEAFANGNQTSAPTVSITSPVDSATFDDNATITITASASDADGSIAKVEFFRGTTSLGTDSVSPYSITWANVSGGSYSLKAVATDNDGLTATSSIVHITVGTVPLVAEAGGPYTGNVGESVSFNGSANGGTSPYTYLWNLGDGSSSTLVTPIHSYDSAGSYTVILTVTDATNINDQDTAIVTITSTSTDGGSCADLTVYPDGLGSYVGGDTVTKNGGIYVCKEWPYSGWANLGGAYEPGVGWAWEDAWTYVGLCGEDTTSSTVPDAPSGLCVTAISSSQITLTWSDNSDNETIFRVQRSTDGTSWADITTVNANITTYTDGSLSSSTTYYYEVRAENSNGNSAYCTMASATTLSDDDDTTTSSLPSKILIGYWHTWDGGVPFIKLRDISSGWDVVNIAFAVPTVAGSADGKMSFTVSGLTSDYTIDDFKADIKTLQNNGKKVVLSIGGYEGYFSLTSSSAVNQFVSDIKGFIDEYGFDGIDIDLEQSSVQFNSGADPDFMNPTSPKVVYMISAIKQICDAYGSDFILSWAPETFYLQLGYQYYGGLNGYVDSRAGVYIPMIYALRDQTTYVHAQLYNSGSIMASDGVVYSMGTTEGIVAMCKMLLTGFNVNQNSSYFFPALRPDQVVIGVPASASAAGSGQVTNAQLQQAFTTLLESYPTFRGIMTWSINWDAYQNNNSFVDSNSAYLNSLKGAGAAMAKAIAEQNQVGLHLEQNTPNPFSSKTTISYTIPTDAYVSLTIYDLMGHEVAALVSENEQAGNYTITFDGSSLSNGIYVCRLHVGNQTEIKKMMLIR